MRDNILVKMPDKLEHFLAATAVVQDYCVQLHKQAAMTRQHPDFWFTLEVADDAYLFFWPIFPRMKMVCRDSIKLSRQEWSCVLDFTDIDRVWRISETPKKNIIEAWGIMVGASPKGLPEFGPMQPPQGHGDKADVLIDERVGVAAELCSYFKSNHPSIKVKISKVDSVRPGTLFNILAEAKTCLLMRGDASYLAAAMAKPTIELYPNDLPVWWLAKPYSEIFKTFYGEEFSAPLIWSVLEEMVLTTTGCKTDDDLVMAIRPFEPAMREV